MGFESYIGAGCVVEFLHGNQPQVAWVIEENSGKLRLYTINKRETKLPSSRALPWSGPRRDGSFGRDEMLEKLAAHEARRTRLCEGIAAMDIWELAQGEVSEESVAFFAGLMWEEPDHDHLAAMGRALLSCKTHFKFHPPRFEVYTAEQVERRLAEQSLAVEREKVVAAGQAFFRELWQGWASGRPRDAAGLAAKLDPEAAEKLAALLKTLLADPDHEDAQPLWTTLKKGLPEHPHLPLVLAQTWGVVPPHYNYHLDQADYAAGDGWAAGHEADVAALAARVEAARTAPEPLAFRSIDSPTTRDIDDAFFVAEGPDGGYRVALALANPAMVWDFGGDLDLAVAHRASSLYLPEATSHMLPERLGADLLSLRQGLDRPALILEWDLDASGAARSFAMRPGFARVAANLDYGSVEAAFERGSADAELVRALSLAEVLRARRLAAGAVVIERSEPDVVLDGYPDRTTVALIPSGDYPRAQLLVSELMVLANAAVAEWAVAQDTPLLYRVQDAAVSPDIHGLWTDPADIYRVVRQLPPTLLETSPRPHVAIGAPAYCTVTSPLRRYVDLLNAAQVHSVLATGAPRLDRAGMEAALPLVTSRSEAVGRVQRFRPRYWKLVYLASRCRERDFDAVVVDEGGGGWVTLAVPEVQIYVRTGREMLGDKVYIGQTFALRLGKIDPLTNDIRVMGAVETAG